MWWINFISGNRSNGELVPVVFWRDLGLIRPVTLSAAVESSFAPAIS